MKEWLKRLANKTPKEINKLAGKIDEYLTRAMRYLRINDEHDRVSLTNIAMIIMLYKIAMTETSTFMDITQLFIAVMGYQGKRIIEKKKK